MFGTKPALDRGELLGSAENVRGPIDQIVLRLEGMMQLFNKQEQVCYLLEERIKLLVGQVDALSDVLKRMMDLMGKH
jgi:hypothetical protein